MEMGKDPARTCRFSSRPPLSEGTSITDPRVAAPAASTRPEEVAGVVTALETEQIGAEQPLDDLASPRELGEDLEAGERDVIEKADPQVRALGPEQRRDELQLVVLHPHDRAFPRLSATRVREALG